MVKMNLKKSALQLHHTWKNKFTCDQCEHLKSLFLEASFILWILFSKRKKAWSKFILKSCLLTERAGIRTPDNLIKSQVLYHLEHPIYKTKYLCDFKILCARFSTFYSARFLINYSSILPTNFLIVKHFISHILK